MPDCLSRLAAPGMGFVLMLGLVACGTPAEYRHPGEVPEGPGMFTGEDGVVRFSTDDQSGPGESAGGQTVAGADRQTPAESRCECPEAAELEAYREFLRWKAEAIGTPEYREFQDWRDWRRRQSE